MRFSGMAASVASFAFSGIAAVMSVAMKPGATALTVMPRAANSRAAGLREADDAGLRRRVVGLAGVAHEADDGRDVDDAAGAFLEHDLRHGLRDMDHALEVRIEDGGEIFFLHAHEKAVARDACVIDEDVDRTERLRDRLAPSPRPLPRRRHPPGREEPCRPPLRWPLSSSSGLRHVPA